MHRSTPVFNSFLQRRDNINFLSMTTTHVFSLLLNNLIIYITKAGETALMKASACGQVEVVDALIEAGTIINLKKMNGHTALAVAVLNQQLMHPNYCQITIICM